jgi:hypothetical protein
MTRSIPGDPAIGGVAYINLLPARLRPSLYDIDVTADRMAAEPAE